jgi:hypothetical protein
MQTTTFKDVVTTLEAYCDQHPQINDFGFGDLSTINTNAMQFPAIWLNPVPSSKNGILTKLKFDMYILDILKQDETNLLDVMNNTLIYGNDVIANFWEDPDETNGFELNEESVSFTPFEGKFDHLLGSWIVNIEIAVKMQINSCTTPTSS